MSGSDHVIDAIDQALDDYSVSVDAMRWSPDAISVEEPDAISLEEADRIVRATYNRRSWYAEEAERRGRNREPVFHHELPRYEGRTTVPFVGGPWHCDVRSMQSPLRRHCVAPPFMGGGIFTRDESALTCMPERELYTLTRVVVRTWLSENLGGNGCLLYVYRYYRLRIDPGHSSPELQAALQVAMLQGFDPRLQRPEVEP